MLQCFWNNYKNFKIFVMSLESQSKNYYVKKIGKNMLEVFRGNFQKKLI